MVVSIDTVETIVTVVSIVTVIAAQIIKLYLPDTNSFSVVFL